MNAILIFGLLFFAGLFFTSLHKLAKADRIIKNQESMIDMLRETIDEITSE